MWVIFHDILIIAVQVKLIVKRTLDSFKKIH